jgi:uncharacterized protein (TIGR00251 family)
MRPLVAWGGEVKITVRVKTNARRNEVQQLAERIYRVTVTAPPVEGKANEKVIELLAEHFGKPKRCFTILRGESFREKLIDVEGLDPVP